jgi:hypothetical protein
LSNMGQEHMIGTTNCTDADTFVRRLGETRKTLEAPKEDQISTTKTAPLIVPSKG